MKKSIFLFFILLIPSLSFAESDIYRDYSDLGELFSLEELEILMSDILGPEPTEPPANTDKCILWTATWCGSPCDKAKKANKDKKEGGYCEVKDYDTEKCGTDKASKDCPKYGDDPVSIPVITDESGNIKAKGADEISDWLNDQ